MIHEPVVFHEGGRAEKEWEKIHECNCVPQGRAELFLVKQVCKHSYKSPNALVKEYQASRVKNDRHAEEMKIARSRSIEQQSQ
jgi:hypothetical protein